MKTPIDKPVTFTFMSYPAKAAKLRWKMTLTFPPGATADSTLSIEVVDGEDKPVAAGTLEYAGKSIKIKAGQAQMTYAEFVAGKHEKNIWLHRRGVLPIPGGLTFV